MITDHLTFNLEKPFPSYHVEFQRIRPTKRTRAAHICGICGSNIPPGSSTLYLSGVTIEIGFYHYHECQYCTADARIQKSS
ncbi:MAG: hypothetical protein JWM44_4184 [Bacilli bacterium]|nr:hypothetical protein [Bacilli bacterium]